MGFEPMTFRTPGRCFTNWATRTLKGTRPLTGFCRWYIIIIVIIKYNYTPFPHIFATLSIRETHSSPLQVTCQPPPSPPYLRNCSSVTVWYHYNCIFWTVWSLVIYLFWFIILNDYFSNIKLWYAKQCIAWLQIKCAFVKNTKVTNLRCKYFCVKKQKYLHSQPSCT